MFRRGQVVKIIHIDEDNDPGWLGLRCEVADAYLNGGVVNVLSNQPQTKLVPLSDRPDAEFPNVGARAWFFWPTDDLEAVKDDE